MACVITASDVGRSFGDHVALDGLSMEVEEGMTIGIIGPSGGGKTTAVRLLCGLDQPSVGSVEIFGTPSSRIGKQERRRLALLSQDPALIDEFTIEEHLILHARLRGIDTTHVAAALERVDLARSYRTRLKQASGGMRRRTGLAAALIGDPDLVFCDEPTAGLDPIVRDEIWGWFNERRDAGRSMVVTTQHVDEAARCDRVLVLRHGEVIADARPADLITESGLTERITIDVGVDRRVDALRVLRRRFGTDVHHLGDLVIVDAEDAADRAADAAEILSSSSIPVDRLDTIVPDLNQIFRSIVEQR